MTKGRKERPGQRRAARKVQIKPEDDAALWQAFTQSIDPLDTKARVPDVEADMFEDMLKREARKTDRVVVGKANGKGSGEPPKPQRRAAADTKPPPPANAFDVKKVRRIRSGRTEIDARIDLHGMRQAEAHSALRIFLYRSAAKGHRLVLVITGKGSGPMRSRSETTFGDFVHEGPAEGGVLRRNVPRWLAEPDLSAIVVGFTTAHIRHGGDGALYVQIRRRASGRG